MELYAHQRALVERAKAATPEKPLRLVLGWDTGAGKTLGGMAAAFARDSALFITPKGLFDRWVDDLEANKPSDGYRFVIATKEAFKKEAANFCRFDAVIVDEAHFFASPDSQMHKALFAFLERAKPSVVLLMSATPRLASPWSVFGMRRLCGLRDSYVSFRAAFFSNVAMGSRRMWVPRKAAEGRLAAALCAVSEFIRLEELVDVPPQVHETVRVQMSPALRRAIDGIEEWQPVTRDLREHQLCGDVNLSGKLPHLLSLGGDNEKIVVICRYRDELEQLSRALVDEYGDRIHQIHGDVPDRDGEEKAFRRPGRAVMLCQAQCAAGWEAPECGTMVFWSKDWGYVNYKQALGRIQRVNAVKRNAYISLEVEGSVDLDVAACVESRKDFYGRLRSARA